MLGVRSAILLLVCCTTLACGGHDTESSHIESTEELIATQPLADSCRDYSLDEIIEQIRHKISMGEIEQKALKSKLGFFVDLKTHCPKK